MKTKKLLKIVTEIANEKYDGHYTIYKFTTHYKGVFRTISDGDLRHTLEELDPYDKLKDLLTNMIQSPDEFDAYKFD